MRLWIGDYLVRFAVWQADLLWLRWAQLSSAVILFIGQLVVHEVQVNLLYACVLSELLRVTTGSSWTERGSTDLLVFLARRNTLRGDLKHSCRCKTQELSISSFMRVRYGPHAGNVFSTTAHSLKNVRAAIGSVWFRGRSRLLPADYPFRRSLSENASKNHSTQLSYNTCFQI